MKTIADAIEIKARYAVALAKVAAPDDPERQMKIASSFSDYSVAELRKLGLQAMATKMAMKPSPKGRLNQLIESYFHKLPFETLKKIAKVVTLEDFSFVGGLKRGNTLALVDKVIDNYGLNAQDLKTAAALTLLDEDVLAKIAVGRVDSKAAESKTMTGKTKRAKDDEDEFDFSDEESSDKEPSEDEGGDFEEGGDEDTGDEDGEDGSEEGSDEMPDLEDFGEDFAEPSDGAEGDLGDLAAVESDIGELKDEVGELKDLLNETNENIQAIDKDLKDVSNLGEEALETKGDDIRDTEGEVDAEFEIPLGDEEGDEEIAEEAEDEGESFEEEKREKQSTYRVIRKVPEKVTKRAMPKRLDRSATERIRKAMSVKDSQTNSSISKMFGEFPDVNNMI